MQHPCAPLNNSLLPRGRTDEAWFPTDFIQIFLQIFLQILGSPNIPSTHHISSIPTHTPYTLPCQYINADWPDGVCQLKSH